ncbi:MAG: hypothetical protein Q9185_000408 [Variospora sp. 1 TL-2023]
MYPSPIIITILLLILTITTTLAIPPSLPTAPSSPAHNLTFLGIQCYHLDPAHDAITPEFCEPLFAYLVSGGDVYRRHTFWNGMRFKRPYQPCLITLTSPARGDTTLAVSFAEIVRRASVVVRECEMGGADVFRGEWRVAVSKGPVRMRGREGVWSLRRVGGGKGVE